MYINALAAVCVGFELELSFEQIKTGLEGFAGVQRRMQKKGEAGGIVVVDDYGHHPTEIRATLSAMKKAWPQNRLVVLFQPHRYSRTQALLKDFQTCFHQADVLVMCDIYAASEVPIDGVSSEILLDGVKKHGHKHTFYLPEVETMAGGLEEILVVGDIVLTLGAGDIVKVGEELLDILEENGSE
jgi:UDP-N-acetylmuramate--alanine ligase